MNTFNNEFKCKVLSVEVRPKYNVFKNDESSLLRLFLCYVHRCALRGDWPSVLGTEVMPSNGKQMQMQFIYFERKISVYRKWIDSILSHTDFTENKSVLVQGFVRNK